VQQPANLSFLCIPHAAQCASDASSTHRLPSTSATGSAHGMQWRARCAPPCSTRACIAHAARLPPCRQTPCASTTPRCCSSGRAASSRRSGAPPQPLVPRPWPLACMRLQHCTLSTGGGQQQRRKQQQPWRGQQAAALRRSSARRVQHACWWQPEGQLLPPQALVSSGSWPASTARTMRPSRRTLALQATTPRLLCAPACAAPAACLLLPIHVATATTA
jgi:hypothetical protein